MTSRKAEAASTRPLDDGRREESCALFSPGRGRYSYMFTFCREGGSEFVMR